MRIFYYMFNYLRVSFLWYRCKFFHRKIFPFVEMFGFCDSCFCFYVKPIVVGACSIFNDDKEI